MNGTWTDENGVTRDGWPPAGYWIASDGRHYPPPLPTAIPTAPVRKVRRLGFFKLVAAIVVGLSIVGVGCTALIGTVLQDSADKVTASNSITTVTTTVPQSSSTPVTTAATTTTTIATTTTIRATTTTAATTTTVKTGTRTNPFTGMLTLGNDWADVQFGPIEDVDPELIKRANQFNDLPAAGQRAVKIGMTAKYTGIEVGKPSTFRFSLGLAGSKGKVYKPAWIADSKGVTGDISDQPDVVNGGSIAGALYFYIDSEDTDLLLVKESTGGPQFIRPGQ